MKKEGGPSVRPLGRSESRDEYAHVYQLEREATDRDYMRTRMLQGTFYGGLDPRRRQEIADGGMVRESKEGMANLPRQAIHCEYPAAGFYETPYLDDGRLD